MDGAGNNAANNPFNITDENLHQHLLVAGIIGAYEFNSGCCIPRTPCRTSSLTGQQWVQELINGHHNRIFENTRMDVRSFLGLVDILQVQGLITEHPSRKVSVEEGVAMALVCVSHKHTQRVLAERFQHSLETINRHVSRSLRAIVKLAPMLIRPMNENGIHPRIRDSRRFFPWFMDCIGAIDGTHVSAWVHSDMQDAYRNIKGLITQNVLCACDHDMRFVYVRAGWEGSAHDARVMKDALLDPDSNFPMPPEGKYYLVDSAYKHMPGFMAPYKNVRGGRGRRGGKEELFNRQHASIRSVIERTFGVLKKRFALLDGPMNNYMISRQRNMVIACCVLHNFIRENLPHDQFFGEEEANGNLGGGADEGNEVNRTQVDFSENGIANWHAVREAISDLMWAHRDNM